MIKLIMQFVQFAVGGIISAEKASATWRKNFAKQAEAIENLFEVQGAKQDEAEQKIITDYEAQLQKDSLFAQLKSAGIVLLMLVIVFALLYSLNKIIK
jgi:hypothetical protein